MCSWARQLSLTGKAPCSKTTVFPFNIFSYGNRPNGGVVNSSPFLELRRAHSIFPSHPLQFFPGARLASLIIEVYALFRKTLDETKFFSHSHQFSISDSMSLYELMDMVPEGTAKPTTGDQPAANPKRTSRYGTGLITLDAGKTKPYQVVKVFYDADVSVPKSAKLTAIGIEHVAAISVSKREDLKNPGDFVLAMRIVDEKDNFLGYKPLNYKQETSIMAHLDFKNAFVLAGAGLNKVAVYQNRFPLVGELKGQAQLEGMGFLSDQHLDKHCPGKDFTFKHSTSLLFQETKPYFLSKMDRTEKIAPHMAEIWAADKFIPDESVNIKASLMLPTELSRLTNTTASFVGLPSVIAQADLLNTLVANQGMTFTGNSEPELKRKAEEPKKEVAKKQKVEESKKKTKKGEKEKKKRNKKEKSDHSKKKKSSSKSTPKAEPIQLPESPPKRQKVEASLDMAHMNYYAKASKIIAELKPGSKAIAAYVAPGSYVETLSALISPGELLTGKTSGGDTALIMVLLFEYWLEKSSNAKLHSPMPLLQFIGTENRDELLKELDRVQPCYRAMEFLAKNCHIFGTPQFCLGKTTFHLAETHLPEYEIELKRNTKLIYNLVNDVRELIRKEGQQKSASASSSSSSSSEEDPFAVD